MARHPATRLMTLTAAALWVVAGCKAPTPTRPKPPATVAASAPAVIKTAASVPPTGTGTTTVISDNGANIIANHGGSLVGRVTAPAGLLSNNGGSIIANHGGGRRLLEATEVPLANVDVALQNADGTPVLGKDGKPITGRTDAQGNYSLPEAAIGTNQLVKVTVPGAGGDLLALAPKDAKSVDVDLASTLVMGYILSNYVRTQADPVGTLNKLPADLEAQARGRAAAALASGQVNATSLAPTSLNQAVDDLRKTDSLLDQHLTTVKKLLVAAGQSDLGNGQPATQVALSAIADVVPLPDGSVYLLCPSDARVWRLTTDGRLIKAVGRAPHVRDASVEGKAGAEAGIAGVRAMASAPDGSVLLLEPTRLMRLGADGILHELWTGKDALALVPRQDGTVWILTAGSAPRTFGKTAIPGKPSTLLAVGKGQPTTLHSFTEAETVWLSTVRRAAIMPDGSLALGGTEATETPPTRPGGRTIRRTATAVFKLDPTNFGTSVGAHKTATQTLITLDSQGHLVTGSGSPLALSDGLTFKPAAASDGTTAHLVDMAPLAVRPDGSLLAAADGRLYQVTAGGTKLLAGMLDAPTSGPADAIAFQAPALLATDTTGRFVVFDSATNHFWRIASGFGNVFTDLPASVPLADDGDPLNAVDLRSASNGDLILRDDWNTPRLLRLTSAGQWSVALTPAEGDTLVDFTATATGFTLLVTRDEDAATHLLQYDAQGRKLDDHVIEADTVPTVVAVTAAGTVYLAADTYLATWTAAGGLATLDDSDDWNAAFMGSTQLLADARGRLLFCDGTTIYRYDPATKAIEHLVGTDGKFFTGDGVDEGVGGSLSAPRLTPAGDLLFLDMDYRQVKQVGAADLK